MSFCTYLQRRLRTIELLVPSDSHAIMTDSEALRETLIDLERSRRAERELRKQTEGLLKGLEILGSMEATDEMFSRLLEMLGDLLEFEEAAVLTGSTADQLTPVATTDALPDDLVWHGEQLTERALEGEPVAVFNVDLVVEWSDLDVDASVDITSALHIGLRNKPKPSLLVCTHSEPGFFSPDHIEVARRFSMLATQALLNRDLRELKLEAFERSVRDQFFSVSSDLMCVVDAQGTILQANPAMNRQLDIEAQSPFIDYVDPADRSRVSTRIDELVDGGDSVSFEARFSDSEGQPRWLQWNMSFNGDDDLFYGAARDITDRKQAHQRLRQLNAELRVARDDALQANRAKSAFLANMSHELRTPLNAVIGYSEMLTEQFQLQDNGEYDTYIGDLERIVVAGRHLLSIIENVLDLSKVQADQVQLEPRNFRLQPLVEDIVSTIEPIVERNDNRVIVDVDDELTMDCDDNKLRQIIFNLASNAAKFTHRGTVEIQATIEVVDDDDWVVISVTDTGVGMNDDELQEIFDAFSQGDDSTTREFDGSGLGLAITDHFTTILGGDIAVESTPGEGTQFTVRIPRAISVDTDSDDTPTIEPPEPSAPGLDVDAPTDSDDRTDSSVDERPVADDGVVLVIDDDPDFQTLVGRTLEQQDYDVVRAVDGAEGLHLIERVRPAVVLLDITLPVLDGWQILEIAKSTSSIADIPIVVVSMVDDRQRGQQLGADDYLVKPVDRRQLVDVVARWNSTSPGR